MSSTTNTNAIQRFTYDWLIRFSELHPVTNEYFEPRKTLHDMPWYESSKCYAPRSSKYYRISLCFSNLMEKYMPFIELNFLNVIYQHEVKDFQLPETSKIVVMIGCIMLRKFVPGTVTNFFINKRIYFNWLAIRVHESTLNLADVKQIISGAIDVEITASVLAQTVLCSEILPLLRHSNSTCLDFKNLIYDDKMPVMLAKTKWLVEREYIGFNIDLCKDKVLSFVDYFLTVPVGQYCHLSITSGYSQKLMYRIIGSIKQKFKAAGYTIERNQLLGPTGAIGFKKTSDTQIDFYTKYVCIVPGFY